MVKLNITFICVMTSPPCKTIEWVNIVFLLIRSHSVFQQDPRESDRSPDLGFCSRSRESSGRAGVMKNQGALLPVFWNWLPLFFKTIPAPYLGAPQPYASASCYLTWTVTWMYRNFPHLSSLASLLLPPVPGTRLAHHRSSVNVCWLSEWMFWILNGQFLLFIYLYGEIG